MTQTRRWLTDANTKWLSLTLNVDWQCLENPLRLPASQMLTNFSQPLRMGPNNFQLAFLINGVKIFHSPVATLASAESETWPIRGGSNFCIFCGTRWNIQRLIKCALTWAEKTGSETGPMPIAKPNPARPGRPTIYEIKALTISLANCAAKQNHWQKIYR